MCQPRRFGANSTGHASTNPVAYRELARMAEAGLVSRGERGARDKQPYELTDAGRAAFAGWLNREPSPETIRFPLLLTILFGRDLPPDRLAGFVAAHRRVHAERLAGYREQRAELGAVAEHEPYAVATLDFGIAYEQAVLGWFDALPEAITGRRPASARRGRSRR